MSIVQEIEKNGQSLWLDYIRRDLIESGELADRIESGAVRGVTSNPSIFQSAIAGSDLYTEDLKKYVAQGLGADEALDLLVLEDIRAAADVFLPLYQQVDGKDGYVSIEVDPDLANETVATFEEAKRLWKAVDHPNTMIKIPATQEGIPAITSAIEMGINVNVTLIFSLERYAEVMEAYIQGLELRYEKGLALDHVASVASFFVSRVDSLVEALLGEREQTAEVQALYGKAAIANAKLAYAQFETVFGSDRFAKLRAAGARVQRPLWASTSTKNPDYPDTYYVDNLIGPDTVNTLPPKTLDAFLDHGVVARTISQDIEKAQADLDALENLGISMQEVTDQLEKEGVEKFAQAYQGLKDTLRDQVKYLKENTSLAEG